MRAPGCVLLLCAAAVTPTWAQCPFSGLVAKLSNVSYQGSNIITAGVAIGELSGTGCAPDGVVSEGDSCYLSKTGYAPASVTCTNTLFQPSIAVFESLECTKLSLSNGEVGSALAGHTVAVVCNAGFTCSAEPCTVTCLDAGSGGGPSTYSVPPRCSQDCVLRTVHGAGLAGDALCVQGGALPAVSRPQCAYVPLPGHMCPTVRVSCDTPGLALPEVPFTCPEAQCTAYSLPRGEGVMPGAAEVGVLPCSDRVVLTAVSQPQCTVQCDVQAGYAPATGVVSCAALRDGDQTTPNTTLPACVPITCSTAAEGLPDFEAAGAVVPADLSACNDARNAACGLECLPGFQRAEGGAGLKCGPKAAPQNDTSEGEWVVTPCVARVAETPRCEFNHLVLRVGTVDYQGVNIITGAGVTIAVASHPGCMPGGLLPAGEICQFKRSGYAPVTVSCVQQPLPEAGDAFSTNPLKLVAQQCSGLAVPNAAVVLASTGYPVKVLCNAGYTCSSPSCQVTCLDARDGVGSLWSTPPHCVEDCVLRTVHGAGLAGDALCVQGGALPAVSRPQCAYVPLPGYMCPTVRVSCDTPGLALPEVPFTCPEAQCTAYSLPRGEGVMPGAAEVGVLPCSDRVVLTAVSQPQCTVQCDVQAGYAPATGVVSCAALRDGDQTTPNTTLPACIPITCSTEAALLLNFEAAGVVAPADLSACIGVQDGACALTCLPGYAAGPVTPKVSCQQTLANRGVWKLDGCLGRAECSTYLCPEGMKMNPFNASRLCTATLLASAPSKPQGIDYVCEYGNANNTDACCVDTGSAFVRYQIDEITQLFRGGATGYGMNVMLSTERSPVVKQCVLCTGGDENTLCRNTEGPWAVNIVPIDNVLTISLDGWDEDDNKLCEFGADEYRVQKTCLVDLSTYAPLVEHVYTCDEAGTSVTVTFKYDPVTVPVTSSPDTWAPDGGPSEPEPEPECTAPTTVGACGPRRHCLLRVVSLQSATSVALSPDGALIAAGFRDNTVRVFGPSGSTVSQMSRGCVSFLPLGVAYHPDGTALAIGGAEGQLVLCSATTGERIRRLQGAGSAAVRSVAFSPDGSLVIGSGGVDGVTTVYTTATGQAHTTIDDYTSAVTFARNGEHLLTARSGLASAVSVYLPNGTSVSEVQSSPGYTVALSLSPDANEIARGFRDGVIRIWSTLTGSDRLSLRPPWKHLYGSAFSPDGTMIAGVGEGGVVVWDATTGMTLRRLIGHTGPVNSLSFTSDSKVLATAGDDGNIFLWDLQ